MSQDNTRAIEVLNWLLEGAHDSADSLRQAASLARNPVFRSLFNERAKDRDALIGEIDAEVRSFGGAPAGEGTMLGDAHRVFTQVRDVVAHGSDKAVVEEAARGEAALEQKFQAVVSDVRMPEPARELAGRVLGKLKSEHEEIEGLSRQFD